MMPVIKYLSVILLISISTFAQIAQGPAQGSVSSGVTVNISSFTAERGQSVNGEKQVRNKVPRAQSDYFEDKTLRLPADAVFYSTDESNRNSVPDTGAGVLLRNFQGITMTNSIPPDPNLAVGPQHIVALANSDIGVWDKNGNLLKRVSGDNFFRSLLSAPNVFDPKVVYDHFAKRFVMVWLNENDAAQTGYLLISVSADSLANGIWYNYALPAHFNGSAQVANWSDYQGVGYDDKAIYVTSNQWNFSSGSFDYAKIRIIPKDSLYANTKGSVSWFDFWGVKVPSSSSSAFTIRPTQMHGIATGDYKLVQVPDYGGNYYSVYTITNPSTNPVLTGTKVTVTSFSSAPDGSQLGGGTALESGGSGLTNEPILRNGKLYLTHPIKNPSAGSYSAIRYAIINAVSNTVIEEGNLASSGNYYMYPSICVDKDENIAVTFSRSGTSEYAGAFFASKQKGAVAGLNKSVMIKKGMGHYDVTYGSGRNRWGDYLGIGLDPENEQNVWMLTEYAGATNQWATWISEIRMVPFEGNYVTTPTKSLGFSNVEVNTNSDTLIALVSNFGKNAVPITQISHKASDLEILNLPSFPYSLGTYDTLKLKIVYKPIAVGNLVDTIDFSSSGLTIAAIPLTGHAYTIQKAIAGRMYGLSQGAQGGNLYSINRFTAESAQIGYTNFTDIKSFDVNPLTGYMFGVRALDEGVQIVRMNALQGDSYKYFELPIISVSMCAFDKTGGFYIGTRTGLIYKVNLENKTYSFIDTVKTAIASLAFDPSDNNCFASIWKPIGTLKDIILKVNTATGDTLVLGKTNRNSIVYDLSFDVFGNLYGFENASDQTANIIKIDKSTGLAELVGNTGISGLTSLAYNFMNASDIKTETSAEAPVKNYNLEQNYPNPFNPETVIHYGVQERSHINIKVFDLLGSEIATLYNGEREQGRYECSWNGSNNYGTKVVAGVYFYKMEIKSSDNVKSGSLTKKMILLK